MTNRFYFLLAFSLVFTVFIQAQTPSATRQKMAIFTPLYLDEAFNGTGGYKYSGKNFPKQSIAGLEFYHGAALAIDSLNKMKVSLDVYVYDSKSGTETLEQQFSKCAADGVSMVLANCSMSELTTMARLGADKKITVLNATVPNDANTEDNPYFVVLNPTLQTQVEGLYQYIKNNYKDKKITVITRKSNSEQYIKNVLERLNKHYKDALSLQFEEINDDGALEALGTDIAVANSMVYIVSSLDTELGAKVLKQLSAVNKSETPVIIVGMPTWESLRISNPEYKGLEIVYTTPFYNSRLDEVSKHITAYYNKKMYARPSDLVFRAFGLTYKFGNLLSHYGKDINKEFDSKDYRMFFDFNIQPEYKNQKISHYENKKLYYLKYLNGTLQSVN